jgi:phage-related protein
MGTGETSKPLFWVGSSKKDLKGCPVEVRQTMGFALWQAQGGRKHIDAKPLKGFGGAGVLEVVADHDGSTYRAVYVVKLAGAVYVLHAFQKKSKKRVKTQKQELELVRKRLKMAEEHYAEWRATQKRETDESGDGGGK